MTRRELGPGLAMAIRQVLEELAVILESYPAAVVVGGTVPFLTTPQEREPHEGTVDIDVVLDLEQPGADPVLTLHEVLERRLFQQDARFPFRYVKSVVVNLDEYRVFLDLLAGGTAPPSGFRTIRTEDVRVSIIPGVEVALEHLHRVPLPGAPHLTLAVASLPSFLTMKAAALEGRDELGKTKDAYDIVYCLRNAEGGIDRIAADFRMRQDEPLIADGLRRLGQLFASVTAVGPVAFGRRGDDAEQEALLAREAFERVQMLLERVRATPEEGESRGESWLRD